MQYKLYLEEGDYQDIDTKEERNMLKCNIAWTPQGENVGWDFFETDEEAMQHYNIELKPKEEEIYE
jgi:hypothetical protein